MPTNPANAPETVANFDVSHIADYWVGFAKELIKSQSARQAEFIEHDRTRAKSYLDRILAMVDIIGEAQLDLPASHPQAYPVQAFPLDENIEALQNDLVKGVLRRMKAGYLEVVNSQSRDSSSGLHSFDQQRFRALIDSTKNLIDQVSGPLDMPEQIGPNIAGGTNGGDNSGGGGQA